MGWNLLFSLITVFSAVALVPSAGPEYWTARAACLVFGALLVISVACTIAGNALRKSLR